MPETKVLSKNHSVTLGDGTQLEYTLRGLLEEEIDNWAQFCASVFSYKANPPPASYFRNHYYNDPHREASLIRIADIDGQIVASCRVFRRTIFVGNAVSESDEGGEQKLARAGGIGEVCTDIHHRRRGLSRQLLSDALQIMKEDENISLSFLHSAPDFFPLYRSVGFHCAETKWTNVPLSLSSSIRKTHSGVFNIRLARFPADTEALMPIHTNYSEKRFAGCIIRSQEYWNAYISQEVKTSLFVAEKDDKIHAFISIRPRGGQYQVCDFGCHRIVDESAVFLPLLCAASASFENPSFELKIPTALYGKVSTTVKRIVRSEVSEESDWGWMYCSLQKGSFTPSLTTPDSHLIWPVDSF